MRLRCLSEGVDPDFLSEEGGRERRNQGPLLQPRRELLIGVIVLDRSPRKQPEATFINHPGKMNHSITEFDV